MPKGGWHAKLTEHGRLCYGFGEYIKETPKVAVFKRFYFRKTTDKLRLQCFSWSRTVTK